MEKTEKMSINLVNRSFGYFLIIISNILLNYINSANSTYDLIDINPIAYIATNLYLFDIFHQIMIDTNAFKHSITSYR